MSSHASRSKEELVDLLETQEKEYAALKEKVTQLTKALEEAMSKLKECQAIPTMPLEEFKRTLDEIGITEVKNPLNIPPSKDLQNAKPMDRFQSIAEIFASGFAPGTGWVDVWSAKDAGVSDDESMKRRQKTKRMFHARTLLFPSLF